MLPGHNQFTHTAAHMAWYATVNALFGSFWKFKVDYSVVPWCTFCHPEVARVGINETAAAAQGIAHEVTLFDVGELDRAIADEEGHGVVKIITPPGKDTILGVTIVRRSCRRFNQRIHPGDETRHRFETDHGHHTHLSHPGGNEQICRQ